MLSAVLPDAAANRKHSTHVVGHNHPATFALHTLDEYLLSQQYYPDAVCNDGSPGARRSPSLRAPCASDPHTTVSPIRIASGRHSGLLRPTNSRARPYHRFSSPGGFYYSNATIAAKSNLWLVYLQGGGWCAPPLSPRARSHSARQHHHAALRPSASSPPLTHVPFSPPLFIIAIYTSIQSSH